MQNKFMSMSVLMAAMMGVGLVGCSKPAEKTEQTKTESTATPAADGDTIKVGILHSLSGTMAISETSLKDTALMTINEINANVVNLFYLLSKNSMGCCSIQCNMKVKNNLKIFSIQVLHRTNKRFQLLNI